MEEQRPVESGMELLRWRYEESQWRDLTVLLAWSKQPERRRKLIAKIAVTVLIAFLAVYVPVSVAHGGSDAFLVGVAVVDIVLLIAAGAIALGWGEVRDQAGKAPEVLITSAGVRIGKRQVRFRGRTRLRRAAFIDQDGPAHLLLQIGKETLEIPIPERLCSDAAELAATLQNIASPSKVEPETLEKLELQKKR